ncbi:MAG TPA: plasmid maintenance system antidote protein [Bacteroidales bacterium]|nr:plasmid maintenance system antidote protein [Bacteroidales bacterium]HOX78105.1 plasmid maintenance system antidote protein [Bacteroidales bacterium]HPM92405.1 plasmid maintenance system antidote protein [Bacteroidales bacterium]
MNNELTIIKGIHPGFYLERELRRRNLGKSKFAISVGEYPQTLVSITKGKRKMNTSLALKIEKELGLEEGYLMILQIYHDIEKEKMNLNLSRPDLSKIRPVLFWDTEPEKINWILQKEAVIKRVFERGNEEEKEELIRFYGIDAVNEVIKNGNS